MTQSNCFEYHYFQFEVCLIHTQNIAAVTNHDPEVRPSRMIRCCILYPSTASDVWINIHHCITGNLCTVLYSKPVLIFLNGDQLAVIEVGGIVKYNNLLVCSLHTLLFSFYKCSSSVSEILGSGNYFTSCLFFSTFFQACGQVIQSMRSPSTSNCCLYNSGFAIMRSFLFQVVLCQTDKQCPKFMPTGHLHFSQQKIR